MLKWRTIRSAWLSIIRKGSLRLVNSRLKRTSLWCSKIAFITVKITVGRWGLPLIFLLSRGVKLMMRAVWSQRAKYIWRMTTLNLILTMNNQSNYRSTITKAVLIYMRTFILKRQHKTIRMKDKSHFTQYKTSWNKTSLIFHSTWWSRQNTVRDRPWVIS
jgi:hypothetical protein